ncbi:MAG: thioredoxin domain-containing protein [Balneolaceae bacterium]|nr:thioredoxin domain-containing protein [Balneolaceae bacterium]
MEKEVVNYLHHLNSPVSEQLCKKRIASHPDYPSILAVSDTLQQLGIAHTVARSNKKNLSDLPLPILLHLNTAGGSLLPVYDAKDFENSGEKLNHWSGILIKAEPTTEIADKENKKALDEEKRFKILSSSLIMTVAGLVAIPLLLSFSWVPLLLTATALAGVLTGYFLFAKDLGITYRAVESFCNAGTGAGCGKVLRSEQGKLFGFITFSDLTLGYFAAQLVSIGLFVPLWVGSGLLAVLGWLSILALPMIGYSLWLQAVKIKEWCRLCLVVSGILAVQAFIFGYLFYSGWINPMAFVLPEVVMTLILFGLSGSSLLLLKQTVQQKNWAVQNEIAAARVKNSPEVFTGLLFKQRQVDTTPFDHDFLIGSPDAPIKLTMAVNLYCGPCKNELEQAKELLSIYPAEVSLSLRLLRSGDEGKTSGLLLHNWLLKVKNRSNGQSNGQELIDEWYEVMDSKKFADSHPVNGKLTEPEVTAYSTTHYDWVKNAKITQTPTTFMNGFELPPAYRVKDLVTLIPGLTDAFGNQTGLNSGKLNSKNAKK